MQGLDRPQLCDGFNSVDRVLEELAAVINASETLHRPKIIAESLVPEVIDFLIAGEETVRTYVKTISVEYFGSSESARQVIPVNDDDVVFSQFLEFICSPQTGWP
jgi:hypothetical protein